MEIEIKVSPIRIQIGLSEDVLALLQLLITGVADDPVARAAQSVRAAMARGAADRASLERVRDKLNDGLEDFIASESGFQVDPGSAPFPAETPVAAAPISGAAAVTLPAATGLPASPPDFLTRLGRVWTDERIAFLKLHYPAGMKIDDLFERLSAMDGLPIANRKAVGVRAASLGLKRELRDGEPVNEALDGPIVRTAVAPAAPTSPEPLGVPPSLLAAPWTSIIRWAQTKKIDTVSGSDDEVLTRINRGRYQCGLPAFTCDDQQVAA